MIEAIGKGALASAPGTRPATAPSVRGDAFARELASSRSPTPVLRFSAHAQQRLNDRQIRFSDAEHARIAESADLAASKGSREAVLLMDRLALVVAVPKRVVITVVEPNVGDHAVFTNIDSVIVMPPKPEA